VCDDSTARLGRTVQRTLGRTVRRSIFPTLGRSHRAAQLVVSLQSPLPCHQLAVVAARRKYCHGRGRETCLIELNPDMIYSLCCSPSMILSISGTIFRSSADAVIGVSLPLAANIAYIFPHLLEVCLADPAPPFLIKGDFSSQRQPRSTPFKPYTMVKISRVAALILAFSGCAYAS
jgi:hypothetical protein